MTSWFKTQQNQHFRSLFILGDHQNFKGNNKKLGNNSVNKLLSVFYLHNSNLLYFHSLTTDQKETVEKDNLLYFYRKTHAHGSLFVIFIKF